MAGPDAGGGCERIRALIERAYVEEPGPAEREEVARHLPGCGACRAFRAEAESLERALRAGGAQWRQAPAPAALLARLERQVDQAAPPPSFLRRLLEFFRSPLPAVALAAGLAVAVAFSLKTPWPRPGPDFAVVPPAPTPGALPAAGAWTVASLDGEGRVEGADGARRPLAVGFALASDARVEALGGRLTLARADGLVSLELRGAARAALPARDRVFLDEGRLRVEAEPGRAGPFVVEAGPCTVALVGTVLDVVRTGDRVEVSVARGEVLVRSGTASLSVGEGDGPAVVSGPGLVAWKATLPTGAAPGPTAGREGSVHGFTSGDSQQTPGLGGP